MRNVSKALNSGRVPSVNLIFTCPDNSLAISRNSIEFSCNLPLSFPCIFKEPVSCSRKSSIFNLFP